MYNYIIVDQVELEAIYEQFKSLSTANTFNDDGGIQKEIFEQCLGPLGLEKNLVTERIFQFFDADGDGVICFGELVGGLSILCKGSLDEKIRCMCSTQFLAFTFDEPCRMNCSTVV